MSDDGGWIGSPVGSEACDSTAEAEEELWRLAELEASHAQDRLEELIGEEAVAGDAGSSIELYVGRDGTG